MYHPVLGKNWIISSLLNSINYCDNSTLRIRAVGVLLYFGDYPFKGIIALASLVFGNTYRGLPPYLDQALVESRSETIEVVLVFLLSRLSTSRMLCSYLETFTF